jgi:hypothetical protein
MPIVESNNGFKYNFTNKDEKDDQWFDYWFETAANRQTEPGDLPMTACEASSTFLYIRRFLDDKRSSLENKPTEVPLFFNVCYKWYGANQQGRGIYGHYYPDKKVVPNGPKQDYVRCNAPRYVLKSIDNIPIVQNRQNIERKAYTKIRQSINNYLNALNHAAPTGHGDFCNVVHRMIVTLKNERLKPHRPMVV